MSDLFLTTAEFAFEFFDRCIMKEAVTMEERNKILLEMLEEKKAEYIGRTDKDQNGLVKELEANGFKVLGLKPKESK